MSLYPEHEKLKAIQEKSQTIGEFLDWLQDEKGIHLGEWGPERLAMYPSMVPKIGLLAEFFGIEKEVIEREKRAMLEALRAMNEARP